MLQAIRQQIRNLRDNDSSLKTRALSVGIWSVVELGAGNVLRLASNLIMTRLLVPEAFGLMAMVVMVQIALTLFTDLGIQQSIIRSKKGADPGFLRVAWTVQIARSGAITLFVLAVALLLHLAAPTWAPEGTVYADPQLPMLIGVSSLSMLMVGMESTNLWLAHRNMQLKRPALLTIGGQFSGIAAMIAFATMQPTVWALLFGSMFGVAVKTALTHLVLPGPRMKLCWDRDVAAELWEFGKFILGSSALGFAASYADRLILGALLDIRDFGFYSIAIIWVQVFVVLLRTLSNTVGLPVFSRLNRENPDHIPNVYSRMLLVIMVIAFVAFLACLIGGPYLIDLLYRPEYATSGVFISLLAVMVLPSVYWLTYMVSLSQGDSRTMLIVSVYRALAVPLCLWVGYLLLGIPGALIGSGLAHLAGMPMAVIRVRETLGRAIRMNIYWFVLVLAAAVLVVLLYG